MAQAFAQRDNHFIGHFKTIGFVHDIKIVHGNDGEGAWILVKGCNADGFAQGISHAGPVHHARQGITV